MIRWWYDVRIIWSWLFPQTSQTRDVLLRLKIWKLDIWYRWIKTNDIVSSFLLHVNSNAIYSVSISIVSKKLTVMGSLYRIRIQRLLLNFNYNMKDLFSPLCLFEWEKYKTWVLYWQLISVCPMEDLLYYYRMCIS